MDDTEKKEKPKMSKRIYESEALAADYDGVYTKITYKAQGKSARVLSDSEPVPVLGKVAEILRSRGIDPATRRQYGSMAGCPVMPTEEAEAIRAAILALPEYQAAELREERERLVREIGYILDETEEKREQAYERDLGGIPSYDSAEYRTAVAALKAFDAAHPEIKAAIEAERKADTERHMWD